MAGKNKGIVIGAAAIGLGALVLMSGKKKKRSSKGENGGRKPTITPFNPQGFPVVQELRLTRDFGMGEEEVLAYILEGPIVNNEVRYTVSIPEQRNVLDPIYDDASASLVSIDMARGHLASLIDSLPSPYPQTSDKGLQPTIVGIPIEKSSRGAFTGFVVFVARADQFFYNIPPQGPMSSPITKGPYTNKDDAFNDLTVALEDIAASVTQA